jgi:hypothetical protein
MSMEQLIAFQKKANEDMKGVKNLPAGLETGLSEMATKLHESKQNSQYYS